MVNSCDNCSEDCKHLNDCISELYRDVLTRCNINIKETPPDSPEVPQNANNGEGIGFQRLRRITGYITGDINTWNNAKKKELGDRVKHGTV